MTEPKTSLLSFVRKNQTLALLAAAHVPFLIAYFVSLWRFEHYQFFPFAIAAFVWFYVSRGEREVIQLGWIGRVAIAMDMLLLLFAAMTNWVQPVMAATTLFCFAVTRGSREWQYPVRMTRLTLLPLLLVRPPSKLDTHALQWLQEKTTLLASRVAETFGYLHLQRGNIIELPDKQFLVEEACSGVQSLFTVLFLAAFIICWHRRSLLQTCFLFGTGFLYAGAMNVLRISSIVVAWENWQWDLSHGWQHDALGYVALLAAMVLLLSTDWLLNFLFAPFEDHAYGPFAGAYSNPLTAIWNFVCGGRLWPPVEPEPKIIPQKLLSGGILSFVILVVGLQLLMLVASGTGRFALPESSLVTFDEAVLPDELEGFQCGGYTTESRGSDSNWGEFSNIWSFRGHGMDVVVSCDHPFLNWHYLNICYTAGGWSLSASDKLEGQDDWPSVTFSMMDQLAGRHGRVIYSHFTADGSSLAPAATSFSLTYIIERIRNRGGGSIWSFVSAPEDNTSYQVQVLAESGKPLTDDQFAAIKRLHEATRRLLREHYRATRSTSVVSVAN